MEMLVRAPYEAPEKKAKKKAMGTIKSLRRKVVSDSSSEDTEAHSSNDNKEEEEESSPPIRGRQEKEGRPIWGGRRVQEGKDPPRSGCPGTSPWRSRKYPDTIIVLGMFYFIASYHAEHDHAAPPKPVSMYPLRMSL